MIVAWNGHIKIIFTPSWISYLDEYMSVWMKKFTYPGFVFCPCKTNTKGNYYHTICCGESGIIYGGDIVEGHKLGGVFEQKPYRSFQWVLNSCQPVYVWKLF